MLFREMDDLGNTIETIDRMLNVIAGNQMTRDGRTLDDTPQM
jgi:hypothetical protein